MTATITVPNSLDDQSFEQVLAQAAEYPRSEPLTVDARHCTFATAYGLPALLALAQTRAEKPVFLPPEDTDTVRYWERAGFFRHAQLAYAVHGALPQATSAVANDVLLEVTRLQRGAGVPDVIEGIQRRAIAIFTRSLRLEKRLAQGRATALAETCENVVEHGESGGWMMVQAYRFKKRLGGGFVALIAVCETAAAVGAGERGLAFGRGFGREDIEGLGRCARRLDGKFSVRSGTSRRTVVPVWDDDLPLVENLAPFPGAQLQVTIPARAAA